MLAVAPALALHPPGAFLQRTSVATHSMGIVLDCVADSVATVLTGYLAGVAAGPAVASIAATSTGVKNGSRSWSELRTALGLSFLFSALALWLAATALTLGSTAVSLAAPLVKLPLLVVMVGLIAGTVPMAALLSGTFFSPAIPFKDERDLSEYQNMQDSYRSDSWQPPKLWRGED